MGKIRKTFFLNRDMMIALKEMHWPSPPWHFGHRHSPAFWALKTGIWISTWGAPFQKYQNRIFSNYILNFESLYLNWSRRSNIFTKLFLALYLSTIWIKKDIFLNENITFGKWYGRCKLEKIASLDKFFMTKQYLATSARDKMPIHLKLESTDIEEKVVELL